ncbi:hypothetical protein KEM54_005859 [Ascosphaera aggregata]|nr:hypothetical protein KEM54_005859 [Ascosphaera aggregata]
MLLGELSIPPSASRQCTNAGSVRLCAAGTVGIAAAGFALVRQDKQPLTPPLTPPKLSKRLRLRRNSEKLRRKILSPSGQPLIARSPLGRFLDMSPPAQSAHDAYQDASHDTTITSAHHDPKTPQRRHKHSPSRFLFRRSSSQSRRVLDNSVGAVGQTRRTDRETPAVAAAQTKYLPTAGPALPSSSFREVALSDVRNVDDRDQTQRFNQWQTLPRPYTRSSFSERVVQDPQQLKHELSSHQQSRQHFSKLPWMKRFSHHFIHSSLASSPLPMPSNNDENDVRADLHNDSLPAFPSSQDPFTDANPDLFLPLSPPRQLKKTRRFQRPVLRTDELSHSGSDPINHEDSTPRDNQPAEVTNKTPASPFWRIRINRRYRPNSLTFGKDEYEQITLPSPTSPGDGSTSLPQRPHSAGHPGMSTQLHEGGRSTMEDAWQPYFSPVSDHMWSPSLSPRSTRKSHVSRPSLPLLSPDPNNPPILVLASDMMSPAANDRWNHPAYHQSHLSPVQSVAEHSSARQSLGERSFGDDAPSVGEGVPTTASVPTHSDPQEYPGSWKLSKARTLPRPASFIHHTMNQSTFARIDDQMPRSPMISHSLPLRRKRSFNNPSAGEFTITDPFPPRDFNRSEQNFSSTFPRAARLRRHPAQLNLRPDSGITWAPTPLPSGTSSGVALSQQKMSPNSNFSSPTLTGTISDRTCISEDDSDQWSNCGYRNGRRTFRLYRPSSRPRGPPLENIFIQPLASTLEEGLPDAEPQSANSSYELEQQFKDPNDNRAFALHCDTLESAVDIHPKADERSMVSRLFDSQHSRSHSIASSNHELQCCGPTEKPISARLPFASTVLFPVHHRRNSSTSYEARRKGFDDSISDWDDLNPLAPEYDNDHEFPRLRPSKSESSTMPHGFTKKSRMRPDSAVLLQEQLPIETRASVFDWSERHHDVSRDQDRKNGRIIRPKTAYEKQSPLNAPRGSRDNLRRNCSAVHLRSKSVPASKTPSTGSNDASIMKFATWGLGSKGVSEDWDGDFDFDDDDFENAKEGGDTNGTNNKVSSSGTTMRVPSSIMESQASVHGQFGQVQELTMLVEELKRLVARGNMLHLCEGLSSELWREAKAIIHLANFDEEDDSITKEEVAIARNVTHVSEQHAAGRNSVSPAVSFDSVEAAFASFSSSPVSWEKGVNPNIQVKSGMLPNLQSSPDFNQSNLDGKPAKPEVPKTSKERLPFDTQSLRALVARASAVTRSLKDILRKAEGVEVGTKPYDLSHKSSFTTGSPKSVDDRRVLRRLSQMFVRPLHENESALSILTSSSAHRKPSTPSMLVTELF